MRPAKRGRTGLAAADTASAVHRHACGLVDHEQPFVFVKNMRGKLRLRGLQGAWRRAARGLDGRQPQAVARLQAVLGPHTPAVHPNFPAPQDPVDMAFRDAFEEARQIIVDALGLAFLAHLKPCCGIFT